VRSNSREAYVFTGRHYRISYDAWRPTHYIVEIRLIGFGWWAHVYKGRNKPLLRGPVILATLYPFYQAGFWLVIILAVAVCVVGCVLYSISGILRAVGYLLMLMPSSARNELRECTTIQSNGLGDLF
jgi:hypothetical protein